MKAEASKFERNEEKSLLIQKIHSSAFRDNNYAAPVIFIATLGIQVCGKKEINYKPQHWAEAIMLCRCKFASKIELSTTSVIFTHDSPSSCFWISIFSGLRFLCITPSSCMCFEFHKYKE
jgi:hypothetical protein